MAEPDTFEEENPLSPGSLALILSNLFRREDGEPMDFYIRKIRFQDRSDKVQLKEKLEKLNEEIDRCGGKLEKEPISNHAVELAFPEVFDDERNIDSDIFDAEYIYTCVKSLEILELEPFRIGKSPYSGDVNITDILRGISSWDSVNRSISTPKKGRKLPNFGLGIELSPQLNRCAPPKKKKRHEYTIKEDVAVLKFVLKHNLYDQVGGNKTWKTVAKAFPQHSYQSLQNHFRRAILPNLDKYTDLTESEKNLFRRDCTSDLISRGVFRRPKQQNVSSSDELSDASATEVDPSRICSAELNEPEDDIIEATPTTVTEKENKEELSHQCTGIFPHVVINESPTDLELPESDFVSASTNLNPEKDIAHQSPSTSAVAESKSVLNEDQIELDPNSTELPPDDVSSECSTVRVSPPVTRSTRVIRESNISNSPEEILEVLEQEPLELSESESSETQTVINSENEASNLEKTEAPRRKKLNRLYTLEEDKLILSYICDNERYNHIHGKNLWTQMQNTILSKYKRTWESAKARFLKTIIRDIDSEEYGLDEEVIKRFRAKCKTPRERYEDARSDSAHESCIASTDSGSESIASKNLDRRSNKTSKLGRAYSNWEDRLIINYIIETQRFSEVRGRTLWVDIQDIALCDCSRSWESAKNRFLKTILKSIHKYQLDPRTVQKFRDGAVADRHMGGARKNRSRVNPAKHPALQNSSKIPTLHNKIQKTVKPSKRQLFKRHVVPLPVLFSPHPRPVAAKNAGKLTGVNIRREIDSVRKDLMRQEARNISLQEPSESLPTTVRRRSKTYPPASTSSVQTPLQAHLLNRPNTPPSISFSIKNCSVVLKRLTNEELMQYCRKSADSGSKLQESVLGEIDEESCPKTASSPLKAVNKFRIEYSPTFLAAKASQLQSVKSSFFSSLELKSNLSSAENCKQNVSEDRIFNCRNIP